MSIKKVLKKIYMLPSNVYNQTMYYIKGVQVGKKHETLGRIYIKKHKGSKIRIGNHVRIRSSGTANPIGGSPRTYFQTLKGAELIIGDFSGLSNCAITSGSRVIIGNHVRIGADTRIYGTDFHSINPIHRTAIPEEGPVPCGDIIIKDYAFIGAGSIILKNTVIGRGAVIGAGSVVTKSIPDFEIWAGNPARKIGEISDDQRL